VYGVTLDHLIVEIDIILMKSEEHKHCCVKYSVCVYLYNSPGITTTQRNGWSRKRDAVGETEKKFLLPLKPPDQFLDGISLLLKKKI